MRNISKLLILLIITLLYGCAKDVSVEYFNYGFCYLDTSQVQIVYPIDKPLNVRFSLCYPYHSYILEEVNSLIKNENIILYAKTRKIVTELEKTEYNKIDSTFSFYWTNKGNFKLFYLSASTGNFKTFDTIFIKQIKVE